MVFTLFVLSIVSRHKFEPACLVLLPRVQEFFFALYFPSFAKEGKTDALVPAF